MFIRLALVSIMIVALALPAHARSCTEITAAETALVRAVLKQDVGAILKSLGAPAADVENFLRASPDVDTARIAARRMIEKLRTACTK